MTRIEATDVRDATPDDRAAIREVHSLAFAGAGEGTTVAQLACDLIDSTTSPPTISLVAEEHSRVAAHVALSPVRFAGHESLVGYLLAPLGVRPDSQRRGLGSLLVAAGIERVRATGADVVLVYGDPAYYGRFGFSAADAARFEPPYELEHPFGWLAYVLCPDRVPEHAVRLICVGPLCDPSLW